MEIGKLTSRDLKELIFDNIKSCRKEVLIRPSVGEDCAVIDYGENALVISTDPITGTSEEIGRLAIHITCNDIATNGVEPIGIMLTIMAPEKTTREEIAKIMKDASEEAYKLNVDIIGGHTEITSAVNRIIISATGIGKKLKKEILNRPKAKLGDVLVLTKGAGIEGTGIICFEKEEELLKVIDKEVIKEGKKLLDNISVVKEGLIGGKHNLSFMHDVTEGGVLGAVWEICDLYGLGCELYEEDIHINESTKHICDYYKINPLRLISSGSMLMGVEKERVESLLTELDEEKIKYSVIGSLTEDPICKLIGKNYEINIEPPKSDELYKVLK